MKAEIEAARRNRGRTAELAAEARYARERHELYKAKTLGPKLTSPARLRELERARDLTAQRLHAAQAFMTDPAEATEPSAPHSDRNRHRDRDWSDEDLGSALL